MTQSSLSGSAAIVGLGATEFSKNSGRTELRLALEATLAALKDAGIDPSEVEGFSSYSVDKVPEYEIARLLGCKDVKFFSQVPHGGGAACAPIMHAAMAVATGVAKVVVVYRAMNERSWYRFGSGSYGFASTPIFENVNYGWYMPHGLHTPASWVGMFAQRYMHTYGATSEDFGRVAVAVRDFAATNPAAFFYGKPITLEEHQASRWICEPLHLLDCCQESDGAVAMVITSAERAKDLRQKPVTMVVSGQSPARGGGIHHTRNPVGGERQGHECALSSRKIIAGDEIEQQPANVGDDSVDADCDTQMARKGLGLNDFSRFAYSGCEAGTFPECPGQS